MAQLRNRIDRGVVRRAGEQMAQLMNRLDRGVVRRVREQDGPAKE